MTVYQYTEDERQAAEEMDAERDEEGLAESIYPVKCFCCDWIGMSDDCRYMRCPNCNMRVVRDEGI